MLGYIPMRFSGALSIGIVFVLSACGSVAESPDSTPVPSEVIEFRRVRSENLQTWAKWNREVALARYRGARARLLDAQSAGKWELVRRCEQYMKEREIDLSRLNQAYQIKLELEEIDGDIKQSESRIRASTVAIRTDFAAYRQGAYDVWSPPKSENMFWDPAPLP